MLARGWRRGDAASLPSGYIVSVLQDQKTSADWSHCSVNKYCWRCALKMVMMDGGHFNRRAGDLIVLIFNSITQAEHFFMCTSAIFTSSLVKCLFKVLAYFSVGLFALLLLSFKGCLCTLDNSLIRYIFHEHVLSLRLVFSFSCKCLLQSRSFTF